MKLRISSLHRRTRSGSEKSKATADLRSKSSGSLELAAGAGEHNVGGDRVADSRQAASANCATSSAVIISAVGMRSVIQADISVST